jgi:hypothetical protein
MEIQIEGEKIKIKNIICINIFIVEDEIFEIYIKNKKNSLIINKECKNKIDNLLNKEKFYISNDLSIDIYKILSFYQINGYDNLFIRIKNYNINTDIKHKKQIDNFEIINKINNF